MCYCADAVRWWRPTAKREHSATYCAQGRGGLRILAIPSQGPRVLYDDGARYEGLPAFDGTAWVPGRPDQL
jgi:hypothetical protein